MLRCLCTSNWEAEFNGRDLRNEVIQPKSLHNDDERHEMIILTLAGAQRLERPLSRDSRDPSPETREGSAESAPSLIST
jgi:hypothetical protein